jgi:hypothetical protein
VPGFPPEQWGPQVDQFLTENGFKRQMYKGMDVWKKGTGWLAAPQIFRIVNEGSRVVIETWIPFALLPGVYLGESGLNSAFGFAIKGGMRSILKVLIGYINAPGALPEGYLP